MGDNSAITIGRIAAFLAVAMTIAYIYMVTKAKNEHEACEAVKGTFKDEHYRRYWTYTVIILGTIGGTVGLLNFVKADGPILVSLVAFMCAIGAILYADTVRTCKQEEVKYDSLKDYFMAHPEYIFVALFLAIAFFGFKKTQSAGNAPSIEPTTNSVNQS